MRGPALAVVTGASTGIGAATARALAAHGLHVLAGVRTDAAAQALRAERIEPVLLDITDADAIGRLAERVAADDRPLRALVNNAGVTLTAPVEAVPLDAWRAHLEVNLLGHVAVTRALLPLLHRGSRIVTVSSAAGLVAGPTMAPYSAGKFALEGFSDALRRELAHLGIRVAVVQPGAVRTPIWAKGAATTAALADGMDERQRARYAPLLAAVSRLSAAQPGRGVAADAVARAVLRAVTARRPRARYRVGADAHLLAAAARLLPDRALDALIARAVPARTARAGDRRRIR